MVTRRGVLLGSGALVTGGLGLRAWRTGLGGGAGQRLELWTEWRSLPWPMPLVAAGVLAASPHNTQPWRFRVRDRMIDLELDERQNLGPVDPFRRQMWLGAGCALENMSVAGAGLGRAVAITALPEGPLATPAARVSMGGEQAARPEVLERITRRHTNRNPYHRDRRIEGALVDELSGLVSDPSTRIDLFDRDEPRGRHFTEAIAEVTRVLVADADFMRASDHWFRLNPREEEEHRDGPSLRCAGVPAFKRILGTLAPAPSDSQSHDAWLSMTIENHCAASPAFGAISLHDPGDHRQLLEAGRLWQRLMLWAAERGLGLQPLDQLLELADREQELGRPKTAEPRLAELTERAFRPVMTFRLGWPVAPAPASARRPLASFVVA
jgi:nitroreductase